jgi:hypothetical protein
MCPRANSVPCGLESFRGAYFARRHKILDVQHLGAVWKGLEPLSRTVSRRGHLATVELEVDHSRVGLRKRDIVADFMAAQSFEFKVMVVVRVLQVDMLGSLSDLIDARGHFLVVVQGRLGPGAGRE